ncbi:hypothetical protein ACQ4M4_11195 [Leptolyngbya sp. AN02str]|uniref:hypothetical protein n=1 Tax=Leptolyngbya sp. AN02str TaxID=3423363 RepID=UPI003D31F6B6
MTDLLGLMPLKRQSWIEGQVCDILAVAEQGQLTIIELKNTEDRYVVQQLTRYHHAIVTTQSMAEQINEALPIRLIAIAPKIHPHNLVDQQYCQLQIELMTFAIEDFNGYPNFCLNDQEKQEVRAIPIPQAFHYQLINSATDHEESIESGRPAPPRSLNQLLQPLSESEVQFVLSIREQILSYSDRMIEIGRSTTTQYGLKKGERDIYKTKVCAEFRPLGPQTRIPKLCLQLPYPKRQKGGPANTYLREPVKGLAWVKVSPQALSNCPQDIQLYFYLGKGNRFSFTYSARQYERIYMQLTGKVRSLSTISAVVALALDEWRELSDRT